MRDPGPVPPGLAAPAPLALRRGLRTTVLDLKTRYRRRRFTPMVTLGFPAGDQVTHVLEPGVAYDFALRAEVVGALLHRSRASRPEPVCWLSRPGQPTLHDLDADWLAAAMAAYAEAAVPLTLVIVTTTGWFDPRTGVGQTWRRLRHR